MLTLVLPGREGWDAANNVFVDEADIVIQLEHSLASLSKWESIFKKPFLSEDDKNEVELLGYVRAMCLTPDLPEDAFQRLTEEHWAQINEYLNDTMTATWFSKEPNHRRATQQITAELIYYWMDVAQINWDAQHWHLNRLFTLIRVHSAHNEAAQRKDGGRMSAEQMQDRRALIERRRREAQRGGEA